MEPSKVVIYGLKLCVFADLLKILDFKKSRKCRFVKMCVKSFKIKKCLKSINIHRRLFAYHVFFAKLMFAFCKKKKIISHLRLSGVIGNVGKFKQGIDFASHEELIKKAFSIKEKSIGKKESPYKIKKFSPKILDAFLAEPPVPSN